MAGLIYILCAATALLCAALLWRSYRRNGVRLLLWSSICFLGLAAENVLHLADHITPAQVDLSLWRNLVGLAALISLIYALIWESK
jgi:hypothetical protein